MAEIMTQLLLKRKHLNLLPSNLTTSGILRFKLRNAVMIPFAIVVQFTIPPNTFTRITFTFGSRDINISDQ